jgi:hypothetical protein
LLTVDEGGVAFGRSEPPQVWIERLNPVGCLAITSSAGLRGVEFGGADSDSPGQNDHAFPVVVQYVDDKAYVVWPTNLQPK